MGAADRAALSFEHCGLLVDQLGFVKVNDKDALQLRIPQNVLAPQITMTDPQPVYFVS